MSIKHNIACVLDNFQKIVNPPLHVWEGTYHILLLPPTLQRVSAANILFSSWFSLGWEGFSLYSSSEGDPH